MLEREGANIIEDRYGFATYKNTGSPESIYLVNVYVVPEKRREGIASKYVDKIFKETKCNFLITSCCIDANNWEESEKAILGYGFKYRKKEGTMKWYVKEKL